MNLSYLYSKIFKRLRGKSVKNSNLHPSCVIYSGSNIVNCKIDKYSYIGYDCQFVNTEVGSFCSVSDHVFVGGLEHPMNWVSTSPVFEDVKQSGPQKRFSLFKVDNTVMTIIGSDVWIGHGATIKAGVVIGHGAVIGSNAMVTKDVPPFAIVAGVPAKLIKYRFDEATITDLLKTKWWTLSDNQISIVAQYIKNPKAFIEKVREIVDIETI
jgi:acetyltransferase-like isoleucine patch superfamily enzyme